jgi:phosphoribosylaminoimidazolecarboxamide formyltransferase/IMP cyclohydrolase
MTKRALISVSNKEGLIPFVQELQKLDFEIISTGGTLRHLQTNGINARPVEQITGFPEIMNGRVKTLHPKIHGGLLALRDNENHQNDMEANDITPIDLVVVNLYPFTQTIAKPGVTLAEAIENIDIGGPTMIRSAAKNYRYVTVITDDRDYSQVLNELQQGGVSEATRLRLAQKVYALMAQYNQAIARYLEQQM